MHTSRRGFSIPLFFLFVMGAAGLAFTSLHTLHFIRSTFSPSDQIGAYVALFLLDGASVTWLILLVYHSITRTERNIALLMLGANIAGVIAATLSDSFIVTGDNGTTAKLSQGWVTIALLGVTTVVLGNVIAGFFYHAADPHAQARMQERDLEGERHAIVLDERRKAIRTMLNEVAPDIAAIEAAALRDQLYSAVSVTQRTFIEGRARPVTAPRKLPQPETARDVTHFANDTADVTEDVSQTVRDMSVTQDQTVPKPPRRTR
jgi:hypothetical protein